MPKSKRQKEFHLSKLVKKDKELKTKLVDEIQSTLDEFNHLYVFKVDNMRNKFLQNIRAELKPGRIFMGKNKVMALALGTSEESEARPNLHLVSSDLTGSVGLLCTDKDLDDINQWLEKFRELDYCRSGAKIQETIVIKEGACFTNYGDPFPHNMEPQLRKLGMPTRLDKGVVTLSRDYEICRAGKPLTPEQGQLLKLFQYPMAEFALKIIGHWHNGQYDSFSKSSESESDQEMIR